MKTRNPGEVGAVLMIMFLIYVGGTIIIASCFLGKWLLALTVFVCDCVIIGLIYQALIKVHPRD
jgi:hypothetical protein